MNFKIDWLEWTEFPTEGSLSSAQWLLERYSDGTQTISKGRYGYEWKHVLCNGTLTIYIAAPEQAERMGIHCVATSDFANYLGEPLHALAKHLSSYEGKLHFTRIDLAADMRGDAITAARVGELCKMGQETGLIRKRQWREVVGDDGGYTFYSGARSSDAMMRCYDKGIETGTMSAGEWTRIEFEIKGDMARDLGAQFKSRTDDRIWTICAEYFYGLAMQHCPRRVLVESGIEAWGLQPRAKDKTRSTGDPDFWIMNTVVASLAKRLATCVTDDEKSEFLELWARTIYARVGKQNARIIVDSFMRALKKR